VKRGSDFVRCNDGVREFPPIPGEYNVCPGDVIFFFGFCFIHH